MLPICISICHVTSFPLYITPSLVLHWCFCMVFPNGCLTLTGQICIITSHPASVVAVSPSPSLHGHDYPNPSSGMHVPSEACVLICSDSLSAIFVCPASQEEVLLLHFLLERHQRAPSILHHQPPWGLPSPRGTGPQHQPGCQAGSPMPWQNWGKYITSMATSWLPWKPPGYHGTT